MRSAALLCYLGACASASEWTRDTAPDKQSHALVGFAVGTIWASALDQIGNHPSKAERLAAALAPIVLVAVGKELWDRHHGGDPECRDALATIVGGSLGICLRWEF